LCIRIGLGLISDCANNIPGKVKENVNVLFEMVMHALKEEKYESGLKMVAIVALGDISLASGELFNQHLE
jgi:hypothetical protein